MPHEETWSVVQSRPENRERAVIAEEDSALVTRFVRGDSAAFDTLFSRYQDYVFHIIYGVVGNTEEARDLTQDVFLQVYRSLPKFRHGSRFATWVYRIAMNRAVDATRSAKRCPFLPFLSEPSSSSESVSGYSPEELADEPESLFICGEERQEIQHILMECPVAHRQALVLRYYRDLSIEEMAEVMDCSVTAAKVRLHRARKVFKDLYEKAQSSYHEAGKEKHNASPITR